MAFFDQARDVGLGTKRYLEASPADLALIATNPAMRAEFKRQMDAQNDPELRDQIVQFILDYADAADDEAKGAERRVDLLDRAGLGIAASITAAGIGATTAAALTAKGAAIGSLLGPAGTLAGGLIGLAITAFGRHSLKKQADQRKSMGNKLRRLIGK